MGSVKGLPAYIVLVVVLFFNVTIKVGGGKYLKEEKKRKKKQLRKYLHKLTAMMEIKFTNRKCARISEKNETVSCYSVQKLLTVMM